MSGVLGEGDYMLIRPRYKRCLKCKRLYLWSLDMGKLWCPYCGPTGTPGAGDILWKKPKRIKK